MSNNQLMRDKIAEFIRTQRAIKRLSQLELAEMTGVNVRTIQKMEYGTRVKESVVNNVIDTLDHEIEWQISIKPKTNENEHE